MFESHIERRKDDLDEVFLWLNSDILQYWNEIFLCVIVLKFCDVQNYPLAQFSSL